MGQRLIKNKRREGGKNDVISFVSKNHKAKRFCLFSSSVTHLLILLNVLFKDKKIYNSNILLEIANLKDFNFLPNIFLPNTFLNFLVK